MVSKVLLYGILIMFCCGLNNFSLELMLARDKGFGPLLTLCQYLFVSCEGLIEHFDFKTFKLKKRAIPFWFHCCIAILFVFIQFINNVSYGFGVSQPFVLCLRSSSLAVSFLLGFTFFNKHYSLKQFFGITLITGGVLLTILADSLIHLCDGCSWGESMIALVGNDTKMIVKEKSTLWFGLDQAYGWIVGVSLLVFALVLSAMLGHLQEYSYRKWKKSPREAMFYSHTLMLPTFLFIEGELSSSFSRWNNSDPIQIANISIGPIMIWLTIINIVTQWMCIRSVYLMTSVSGTLTCNLVLTLRKFMSLILSVWYFANPWTHLHWFGTMLVFVGVMAYSAASQKSAENDIKLLQGSNQNNNRNNIVPLTSNSRLRKR